jgi:hypothetical protein
LIRKIVKVSLNCTIRIADTDVVVIVKKVNDDGTLKRPGFNGFHNNQKTTVTLLPGATFDRYGGIGGNFVSPITNDVSVPFAQRSLP